MSATIRAAASLVIANRRHHIEIALDERRDEIGRTGCVVCRVAVDQHIDVGVDLRKHSADDAALARPLFTSHHGPRQTRELAGAVDRAVVVNVDGAVR